MKAFKSLETLINNGKTSGKAVIKRTSNKVSKEEPPKKRKRTETEETKTTNEDKNRKKRRLKPGTKALREIKTQQKTAQTKNAIAKKSFENMVRDVIKDVTPDGSNIRIGKKALDILQEVSEGYLVQCLSLGHTLDVEIGKRTSITKKGLKIGDTLLSKQHLLNNSVRSTDILGEFTEAFPKSSETSTKKRVYKKKKKSLLNKDDTKPKDMEDDQKDEKTEPSIDATAQEQNTAEDPIEAYPAVDSKI